VSLKSFIWKAFFMLISCWSLSCGSALGSRCACCVERTADL
jgi:hypothetical protein